ncbi:MAG: tRNA (adenosine(37)-N6)-threonylcarbamoyltransferase complex transferase subunit TsaD [Thermodesulfovibrionales bacterium]|nr:tRNA (adenosine(37)-N6)-threonylcarbamoyltransferase complex transferase subunit TsaD [Thermodesulfovibrionales bacterium]
MLILGVDTSCDDTAASLLSAEDGNIEIVSNVVSSQTAVHSKYGGIVPELASRKHLEMIWPVVEEAMSGIGLDKLDAFSVCHGPGLIGSLLVGCSFAKAVCYSTGTPLVSVNHLEGHVLSAFLENPIPEFPFLSLIVSGGHTCLYRVEGFMKYTELGRTRDDAAGEAYDKVSKLLGLGYPGGMQIERLAKEGNPKAIKFPRAYLPGTLDFSFSGLKTAVKLALGSQGLSPAGGMATRDIAASFQSSVIDVLVRKAEWAIKKTRIKRLALSGGVASNSALRERMKEMAEDKEVELYAPRPALCTDNAAMIAFAGYRHFLANDIAGLDLNPKAHLPL